MATLISRQRTRDTSSTGKTSNPQWENMCLSSLRIGNQEDLHSDGGPKMHHGKAPSPRRASTGCGTQARWDPTAKLAVPTDMVKVVLSGKQHPERFSRVYGSYRMRPFVQAPQQCFNCQRFGHMARTYWRENQTCRYCDGSHPSS